LTTGAIKKIILREVGDSLLNSRSSFGVERPKQEGQKMKKKLKKLKLNKETIASLTVPEQDLKKALGGCYGSDFGSCLTDRCSIDYCGTVRCI
jgi:hypothetical protein